MNRTFVATLCNAAARDGDSTLIWFGEPFTEVRVPDEESTPIAVVRRVPAPFSRRKGPRGFPSGPSGPVTGSAGYAL